MQKPVIVYFLIALAAGVTVPLQAGINSRLSQYAGTPVMASVISFIIGTVTLLVFSLVTRTPIPGTASFTGAPWWVITGGILGAFYVVSCVVLANRVGAVSMLALIMAGQMAASILLDHFGLAGYQVQPVNLFKIIGILLITAGVFLIRFS